MDNSSKRLIICGNGFDAHHRLPTTYSHYKDFLMKHYHQVKRDYDNFPCLTDTGKGYWYNIEESLEIDYQPYFEDSVLNNYPDLINDESDSRWDNLWVNIDIDSKFIDMFTGKCFYEFLSTLSYDEKERSFIVERLINANCVFLTFNYTDTLQRLYQIPEDRVLHIHGALKNIKSDNPTSREIRSEIQFGAVEIDADSVEKDIEEQYSDDDFYGVTIKPALSKLVDFIHK